MRQNAFGGRVHPDPLGKLERSPRPSSRNWGRVPTSKGEGRERNGKSDRRGWQVGREEGEGSRGARRIFSRGHRRRKGQWLGCTMASAEHEPITGGLGQSP